MKNEIVENLNAYFDGEIKAAKVKELELAEDDRRDEANFEKVRANVFDIFKTILSVAVKLHGDDMPKVKDFFCTKADKIPESWSASYENAKKHDDAEKMCIEGIKLKAADEIKKEFERILEVNGD